MIAATSISMKAAAVVEVGRPGAGRVSRTLRMPCTLHIGSSSACDLRVVARGVRARHLALEWDGFRLTIVAEPGAGPVHVEGRAVRPPFVLSGGSAKLEIGDAEVRVSVPEASEDEPTLVMDRDRTEVPPPRNDDPTEISERPPLPIDATTTQRVRHHRSRLDAVCGTMEGTEGRIRRVAEGALGWLLRSRVAVATRVLVVGVVLFVPVLRRQATRPTAPALSSAQHPFLSASAPAPSSMPSSFVAPLGSAGTAERGASQIVAMRPAMAARLLASGRRREAADAYGTLSKARQEESVFGVVARILAREERAEESGHVTSEASP